MIIRALGERQIVLAVPELAPWAWLRGESVLRYSTRNNGVVPRTFIASEEVSTQGRKSSVNIVRQQPWRCRSFNALVPALFGGGQKDEFLPNGHS